MKTIIIPKLRVEEFTLKIDRFNELIPIELKDGRFFFDGDYLKPNAMVDPESKVVFKTGIFKEVDGIDSKEQSEITIIKSITVVLTEIQDLIKDFSIVELTKDDFKVDELIEIINK